MKNFSDFDMLPQGTVGLNLSRFDCGRPEVNNFFKKEAQDYQDELFGKTYYLCNPEDWTDVAAGLSSWMRSTTTAP